MRLPLPERIRSRSLAGCLAAVAFLIGLEVLFFTVSFDAGDLRDSGLTGVIRHWSPSLLRAATASAALFALLASRMRPSPFAVLSRHLQASPSLPMLGIHALLVTGLYWLSCELFSQRSPSNLLASAWLLDGLLSIIFVLAAFIRLRFLPGLMRATTRAWVPAVLGAAAAYFAGPSMQSLWSLWRFTRAITFHLVLATITPLLPDVSGWQEMAIIGSPRFSIAIDDRCSGLEGVSLILIFCAVWLWLMRKEYRFPHVLIIFPVSALLIFLLNSVRLAVLFLIGYAGAPAVAMGGYHSQAGWLLFNLTAIGLMLLLGRIPWFAARRTPGNPAETADPTLYYLAPFLAILTATIISKAVTSGFEWAYPLRLFAGASVLFFFRERFRDLNWRIGWAGPAAGALAFALWMAWDSFHPEPSGSMIGAGLAALPLLPRTGWIGCRLLASVLTIPLAEELAFRGYLAPRLVSENFTSVRPDSIGAVPILISSLVFGALHGSRWFIATIVGVLYMAALRHRGSMGDAVAAHALTNALLCLLALTAGRWDLW